MMDLYHELTRRMTLERNEIQGGKMSKYMRDQFSFLGVTAPMRRSIFQQFRKDFSTDLKTHWREIARHLWQSEFRELHYICIELLIKHQRMWTKDDFEFFEQMVVEKSWWDTVDTIATNLIGQYLLDDPKVKNAKSLEWMSSQNMWLNRVSIIFQLKYKEKTDLNILENAIALHKSSSDFFLKKAIGWSLRQYAKTDLIWVRQFLARYELSNLSRKEALKNIAHDQE